MLQFIRSPKRFVVFGLRRLEGVFFVLTGQPQPEGEVLDPAYEFLEDGNDYETLAAKYRAGLSDGSARFIYSAVVIFETAALLKRVYPVMDATNVTGGQREPINEEAPPYEEDGISL